MENNRKRHPMLTSTSPPHTHNGRRNWDRDQRMGGGRENFILSRLEKLKSSIIFTAFDEVS